MSEPGMTVRGDGLLEHLLQGGYGEAVGDLLRECARGYLVERLCLLLDSGQERTAEVGAFITADLGTRGAPLLVDMTRVLDRSFRSVTTTGTSC